MGEFLNHNVKLVALFQVDIRVGSLHGRDLAIYRGSKFCEKVLLFQGIDSLPGREPDIEI